MVTTKKINSACLVIIGNEILSGRTQDKNINHIAKELFICGISLQLVVVIPDQKKIIISQIRKLKNQYDFIITTGGIGPTHDDITSESISLAVKKKYKLHNGAYKELKKYYRKIKSACLIIIGNEILSGRTKDKNINHIAKELFICGISLELVVVIPDQKKIIISQIRKLKNQYDFVITTGGIGPTHDDITSESISLAVKKKYKLHNGAYKELKKYYRKIKSELTDARMKMAYMPEGSKLILNKVSGAPGFKIENIYVFAGIPSIVQAMMKEFKKMIKIKNKFYSTTISTKLFESKIAHLLVQAERKYKNISIGSYPIFDGKPKGVEIVINSQVNKLGVSNAKKFILREINKII